MNTPVNIEKYILQRCDLMTAMKLQKLAYYSQAWSLVWDEESLFEEDIEAWANGLVCPNLYRHHSGKFKLSEDDFEADISSLTKSEKETIDSVIEFYGDKSGQYLSDLTHAEPPWRDAREGLDDGERGNEVISKAVMAEYYGSL